MYNMYLSPAWVTSTMKGVLQTIVWLPANFEFTHLQAVWQQFTGSGVWWLMITSHFVDSGGGGVVVRCTLSEALACFKNALCWLFDEWRINANWRLLSSCGKIRVGRLRLA